MSLPRPTSRFDGIEAAVADYYSEALKRHGATPRGVDWSSAESQRLRFEQLLALRGAPNSRLIDFGCGYGALLDYLRETGRDWAYQGFDISEPMIEHARRRHSRDSHARFTAHPAELDVADYCVASGVFNVKLDVPDETWNDYVRAGLEQLHALSTKGFAFNMLTSYSDADRRRADLFYADPLEVFDFCARTFSRHVTLMHDYPLFEFTMLVRK